MGAVTYSNLDGHHLVSHVAAEVREALAVGTLHAKTGEVVDSFANDSSWRKRLAQSAAEKSFVFAGTRVAAVAALINKVSARDGKPQYGFKHVTLTSAGTVITFQSCPWQEDLVLFTVLPETTQLEQSLVRLRTVISGLLRDIEVVCAPRPALARYVN